MEKGVLCVALKGKTELMGRHWRDRLRFNSLLSPTRAAEQDRLMEGDRKLFLAIFLRNWDGN